MSWVGAVRLGAQASSTSGAGLGPAAEGTASGEGARRETSRTSETAVSSSWGTAGGRVRRRSDQAKCGRLTGCSIAVSFLGLVLMVLVLVVRGGVGLGCGGWAAVMGWFKDRWTFRLSGKGKDEAVGLNGDWVGRCLCAVVRSEDASDRVLLPFVVVVWIEEKEREEREKKGRDGGKEHGPPFAFRNALASTQQQFRHFPVRVTVARARSGCRVPSSAVSDGPYGQRAEPRARWLEISAEAEKKPDLICVRMTMPAALAQGETSVVGTVQVASLQ